MQCEARPHDEVFVSSNHSDDRCGRNEWFDYLMPWLSQAFCWVIASHSGGMTLFSSSKLSEATGVWTENGSIT